MPNVAPGFCQGTKQGTRALATITSRLTVSSFESSSTMRHNTMERLVFANFKQSVPDLVPALNIGSAGAAAARKCHSFPFASLLFQVNVFFRIGGHGTGNLGRMIYDSACLLEQSIPSRGGAPRHHSTEIRSSLKRISILMEFTEIARLKCQHPPIFGQDASASLLILNANLSGQ